MRISKMCFNNFRKLDNNQMLDIENEILIVGKNNTGKTSVYEIFEKFFTGNRGFKFEDFNATSTKRLEINKLYGEFKVLEDKDMVKEIFKKFPKISLTLEITTDGNDKIAKIKGLLYEFDNNQIIQLACYYELVENSKVFDAYQEYCEKYKDQEDKELNIDFFDYLRRNISLFYKRRFEATKPSGTMIIPVQEQYVSKLFNVGLIAAQRVVDDISSQDTGKISMVLWKYYKIATSDTEILDEDKYNDFINNIKDNLDDNYKELFSYLINQVNSNILVNDQQKNVEIISDFNLEDMLKRNSKLRYTVEDLSLPESYNGLGYSNMMYIFIQILNYKLLSDKLDAPFNLLFIEEPESHFHPQMQSTFLIKIQEVLGDLNNVQKIITTHSSYVLQSSDLANVRYFCDYKSYSQIRSLLGYFQDAEQAKFKNFLTKYFKVATCDMFFADKVVFYEGTAERILLPHFINKLVKKHNLERLPKMHISYIEVGGAYAQVFYGLMKFLGIPFLVITDLDTVNMSNAKCKCDINIKDDIKTSNSVIKDWFGFTSSPTITSLLESIIEKGLISKDVDTGQENMITFQIPSIGKDNGRTMEEQIIIENVDLLNELVSNGNMESIKNICKKLNNGSDEFPERWIADKYYEIVDKLKKTDFSLELLSIDDLETPLYIEEGFLWLTKQ